ncbi:MAG: PilZ domain-containing protein [Bryobacteraceae bacterium]|nr:PilZ domain-containing protein [Bryobacteraceae bacterium]
MAEGLSARLRRLAFYDRRRRVRRPLPLLIIGIFFVAVLPLYNYIGLAYRHRSSPSQIAEVLSRLSLLEAALLFASVPVGIGILRVRAWGWWLFLLYSVTLIATNLTVVILRSGPANFGSTVQALVLVAVVFYFLHPDVSAPYMKVHPRGWRFEKRRPLEIDLEVSGKNFRTRDFSARGVYIKWPDCPLALGEEVPLSFELRGERFQVIGGVASLTGHGTGIAFRSLDRATQRRIRAALKQLG